MPGKRAAGQVLIGAALEADMIALMDQVRGGASRSQYVREALAEKLLAEGYKVPAGWTFPPDRTGKGGRPKKKTDQHVEMHGVNHGTIKITQKKKSISTSSARLQKGAAKASKKGSK